MPQAGTSRQHANFSLPLWTRSSPTLSAKTSRVPHGLRSPRHSRSLRSAVTTRLRRCWQRPTNTVATRRLHELRSPRPLHSQRGAVATRLQHGPYCPQRALLQTSKAAMRVLTERLRWQHLRWRFVPVPDLTVALVHATHLARPVLSSRWLPPTLNFCRGGLLRHLTPRWRERPHLGAR